MEHRHGRRQYRRAAGTVRAVTTPPSPPEQRARLAQLNIATLVAPVDDPLVADFVDNLERINAAGEASPGFVWRLQDDGGDATSFRAYPDPLTIVNLTVWESIEALRSFVYRTEHVEFLRRRREWFAAGSTGVALWWIRAGALPTLDDAVRRLAHLQRVGPSPYAFSFASPFDAIVLDEPDDRGGIDSEANTATKTAAKTATDPRTSPTVNR
jgi:hypothetical protein